MSDPRSACAGNGCSGDREPDVLPTPSVGGLPCGGIKPWDGRIGRRYGSRAGSRHPVVAKESSPGVQRSGGAEPLSRVNLRVPLLNPPPRNGQGWGGSGGGGGAGRHRTGRRGHRRGAASPCIARCTVSGRFGVQPLLDAGQRGEPVRPGALDLPRVQLRWGAPTPATYTVQAQDLSVRRPAWRTLARATRRTSRTFAARAGHTYSFRVRGGRGPLRHHHNRRAQRGSARQGLLQPPLADGQAPLPPGRGPRDPDTTTGRLVLSALARGGSTPESIGEQQTVAPGGQPAHKSPEAAPCLRVRWVAIGSSGAGVLYPSLLRVLGGLVALEGYGISARTG